MFGKTYPNCVKKETIDKLRELTKFTPAHIKQLQKAFKNVKGILPDSNPVMQKLKQMLISVDRKTLTQIADADINILSTMAKKKLGFSEEKIDEKVNQSKVNQSFTKVVAFVRKESKKLNDDDLYALTQKLAKWFK